MDQIKVYITMTNRDYNRLENGPMDDIDAAVFSGAIFHNRTNIAAFREQMARWERGLKQAEQIVTEAENEYLL
jgi:hypothetical protein